MNIHWYCKRPRYQGFFIEDNDDTCNKYNYRDILCVVDHPQCLCTHQNKLKKWHWHGTYWVMRIALRHKIPTEYHYSWSKLCQKYQLRRGRDSLSFTVYSAQFQSASKGTLCVWVRKNLKGIIRKSSHKIVDETQFIRKCQVKHFFAQLHNFLTLDFNTLHFFFQKMNSVLRSWKGIWKVNHCGLLSRSR